MPLSGCAADRSRALDSIDFSVGAEAAPGATVLAGPPVGAIFRGCTPAGRSRGFDLFARDGWLIGRTSVPIAGELGALSERVYGELLASIGSRHLCRLWNYVPAINEPGAAGLENYRAFSVGRSLAFERHLGSDFKRRLPASSAVGTRSDQLTVIFAACLVTPEHFENPVQVPAYEYPPEHGPRAPSFARATVVNESAERTVFISGTAAIRGHRTLAPGDTSAQLECTLENLREISLASGAGPDLAAGRARERHVRVYLRHAADLESVVGVLERRLLQPGDVTTYLHADICRRELNVEIEVTVRVDGASAA